MYRAGGERVNRITIAAMGFLALVGAGACTKDDMSRYALGAASYPNIPDCKQVLFDGKPIPGVFFRKLTKAVGERVQGVACHGVSMVADAKSGSMREGGL
jgi:hypothetical protein